GIADSLLRVIERGTGRKRTDPLFTRIGRLLGERPLNQLAAPVLHRLKPLQMAVEVGKVRLSVLRLRRGQTLVVLVLPSFALVLLQPVLVLRHGVKVYNLGRVLATALKDTHNRGDKLDQEAF